MESMISKKEVTIFLAMVLLNPLKLSPSHISLRMRISMLDKLTPKSMLNTLKTAILLLIARTTPTQNTKQASEVPTSKLVVKKRRQKHSPLNLRFCPPAKVAASTTGETTILTDMEATTPTTIASSPRTLITLILPSIRH